MDLVIAHELQVLGSHGMAAHDYPRLLAFVGSARFPLARLVGRTLPLEAGPRALAEVAGATAAGVTVLSPRSPHGLRIRWEVADHAVRRLHAPGDVRVEQRPDAVAGPGESLVRVTSVGLCGSDLHWFAAGAIGDAAIDRPLVLGHEMAGVVLSGPLAGRSVGLDPAVPCGRCRECTSGLEHLCTRMSFAGHGSTDGGLQGAHRLARRADPPAARRVRPGAAERCWSPSASRSTPPTWRTCGPGGRSPSPAAGRSA